MKFKSRTDYSEFRAERNSAIPSERRRADVKQLLNSFSFCFSLKINKLTDELVCLGADGEFSRSVSRVLLRGNVRKS